MPAVISSLGPPQLIMDNDALPTTIVTKFKHPPLPDASNHIRLLEVLDDKYSETIKVRCTISIWALDDVPSYHAISYAWGDPESNTIIVIDGKTFRVRTNCEFVLKQAHWHGQSRYYWIDAICIDQENLEEKGKQVTMMGKIYRTADHVLACVGDHADDSLLLYQESSQISDISKRSRHFSNFLLILCWKHRTPTVRRFLSAAVYFAKRSYFTRLWILQELMNAKEASFLCGSDSLSREDVSSLFWHINHWLSRTAWKHFPTLFSTLFALRQLATSWYTRRISISSGRFPSETLQATFYIMWITNTLKFTDASHLLELARRLQCTHRRDRLYGIISIIQWGDVVPPVPDYTKTDFHIAAGFIQPLFNLESNPTETENPVDLCISIKDSLDLDPVDLCKSIKASMGLNSESEGVSDELEARRFVPGGISASLEIQLGASTTHMRSMATGWRVLGRDLNKEHPGWSIWKLPGILQPMVYLPRRVEEGDWILELQSDLQFDKDILVVREVADGSACHILGRGWSISSLSLRRSDIAFEVFWDPQDLLLFLLTPREDFEAPGEVSYGVCKRETSGSSFAIRKDFV